MRDWIAVVAVLLVAAAACASNDRPTPCDAGDPDCRCEPGTSVECKSSCGKRLRCGVDGFWPDQTECECSTCETLGYSDFCDPENLGVCECVVLGFERCCCLAGDPHCIDSGAVPLDGSAEASDARTPDGSDASAVDAADAGGG